MPRSGVTETLSDAESVRAVHHRTDEQLVQFAGWKPDFEKA
jgi:hypothetical protein